MQNPNNSIHSGEPGSTGRELFEGSTATGHGENAPTFETGYKTGTEAGDRGNHGEHETDLGAGPHKRGTSGAGGITGEAPIGHNQSGDVAGAGASGLSSGPLSSSTHGHPSSDYSHTTGDRVTGGHSGSGTGSLSGRPADITSARKVPHEEHSLHGAGIPSISGTGVSTGAEALGNHNPRSAASGLQGETGPVDQGVIRGGNVGQGQSTANHGHGEREPTRHRLHNQFDHSDEKLLAGARNEANVPRDGKVNLDSANPMNLFNKGAEKANAKADQKADENGMQGGGALEDKARRARDEKHERDERKLYSH